MKDAYLSKFKEDGRVYQLIIAVDEDRKPQILDSKRLSPWVGSGSCETDAFRKIDSNTRLSITELEKLAEAGIELK